MSSHPKELFWGGALWHGASKTIRKQPPICVGLTFH